MKPRTPSAHLIEGRTRFGNRLSAEAKSKIIAGLRGGSRATPLAREFGVSVNCVCQYAKANGISLEVATPTRLTCRDCGHEGPLADFKRGARRCGHVRQCRKCALDESRMRRGSSGPKPLAQRIEERTIPEPNTGCFLWTGALVHGYPEISVNSKSKRAHRVSYEVANGPIPSGLCVLHACDTPACVNPAHLFLGTARDNVHDCIKKGRRRNSFGRTHVRL